MPAHDGVIALCAGRDQIDRHFAYCLDALEVVTRRGRQLLEPAHAQSALRPARHFLVDRFAFGELLGPDRQYIQILAGYAVADPDLQRLHPVQHIELGYAQSGDPVDLYRALEGRGIKPATPPRPSRRGADLFAAHRDLASDIVVELGREWP